MTAASETGVSGHETWVAVFGLGGTIASAAAADGGAVPSRPITELLDEWGCVPANVRVVGTQFRMVASSELTLLDVVELAAEVRRAQQSGARGVVVAQGTDTIEETAFALDVLLSDVTIPVVVTGAMRHPSVPGSDAPANIASALDVAISESARGERVMVVLNDEIHAALFVRKAHTSSPAAFTSWPVGPLGWVTEREVQLPLGVSIPRTELALPENAVMPRVPLVSIGLGDAGESLRAIGATSPDGLVIEAMGGGHVPGDLAEDIGELASRIPLIVTSRTGAGSMLQSTYSFEGSERDLLEQGVVLGGFLTTSKARVFAQLLLAAGLSRTAVAHRFQSLQRVARPLTIQHEGRK